MNHKLFVIGNGFDLHHGIPSRFSDFGSYLATADSKILELIRDYLFVDEDFWNCFETRLATFEADVVIEYAEQFLTPYGAEDWSDASHHDFEYEIEQVVDGLSARLRRRFVDWIRKLPIPAAGTVPVLRCIDPSAVFLSFNYTPTLQRLYGVSEDQVLHIHGRAADPASEIVLGHGWKRLPHEQLSRGIDEATDTRVAGGYRLIDDYFAATFKPTEEIIERHRFAFECLTSVTDVWILGHSLGDVDAPYFRELMKRVNPSARWTASCRGGPSTQQRHFAGLAMSHTLVQFAPLASL